RPAFPTRRSSDLFTFSKLSLGDLPDLILQKSHLPAALLLIYAVSFQFLFQPAVFPVQFFYLFFLILDLQAAEAVQDLHLFFRIKKRLMFMLTVDVQEQGCNLPDICRCSGLSIDLADTPVLH